MGKLTASVVKELLLLARDKSGLLVLFLMPTILVIVVTLVQENVLKTTGETTLRALFVQQDHQEIGLLIEQLLRDSGVVELVEDHEDQRIDETTAVNLLGHGAFPLCIIIPKGLTDAVKARLAWQMADAFNGRDRPPEVSAHLPSVAVYFDPLLQGGFRAAIENMLHRITLNLELEMKAKAFSKGVSDQMRQAFHEILGPTVMNAPISEFPSVNSRWGQERLLGVKAEWSLQGKNKKLPTTVQQNVPAWALFGMFFIVVPLGGALIREKQEGTLVRLLTLPVPYVTLLSGKVIAYVMVCAVQFTLILFVGKTLLPVLGSPPLEMGASAGAVIIVVISAALAASGYGIMLGTLFRTYEQVSMFGPVSIVIAAALGGVMVPVHLMPELMQTISQYSPLAWCLNALVDLFARHGNLQSVFPEILYLLSFFVGTMTIAWSVFIRRSHSSH